MSGMTNFTRAIDKAIAELGVAKTLGPQHAQAALTQARYHINLALDDTKRKGVMSDSPVIPQPQPGRHQRPLYLHLDNHKGKT